MNERDGQQHHFANLELIVMGRPSIPLKVRLQPIDEGR